MKRRRGANAYSASYIVAGFIVFLGVIAIASIIMSGGFLKPTNQRGDMSDIRELAGAMENKCDDASDGSTAITSISVDAKFDEVEKIELAGSDRSYEFIVSVGGDQPQRVSIQGCEYQLKKVGSGPWQGEWNFDVSHESGTSSPPVIKVEATPQ